MDGQGLQEIYPTTSEVMVGPDLTRRTKGKRDSQYEREIRDRRA